MSVKIKATLLLIAIFLLFSCRTEVISFAVTADIHQDIMHDGEARLQTFLDAARKNDVDFIIELGDFCFAKEENIPFLDLWNSHGGEKYHVLGNHDMDICSKEEYTEFVGMPSRYYSFDKGDYHFIVLDTNNLCIEGEYIPYNNGNYYIDRSKRAFIDPEQIEWLKQDLSSTNKHCIIFSHQSLENVLSNGDLIRSILEEENKKAGFTKVVAAFSGHDHTSYMKEINEISYIQINSASNQYVGGKYKCEGRFSDSINKEHPILKSTTPYKDALYSTVFIYKDRMEVKGVKSEFIPPTPKDLNIPSTLHGGIPLVPRNEDFVIKI